MDAVEGRGHLRRPASAPGAAAGRATLAAVFVGGAAGGMARHGLTAALPASSGWPWGTFAANTSGAFLLAVLLVLVLELRSPAPWVRPGLGTGFCGAFTTMSAVAVAVDTLAADGRLTSAIAFLSGSLVVGLAAAAAGVVAGRALVARRRPRHDGGTTR